MTNIYTQHLSKQDAVIQNTYSFSFNTARIDAPASLNQEISLSQLETLIKHGSNKHIFNLYKIIQSCAIQWYENSDHRAKNDLDIYKKTLAWLQPAGFLKHGHSAKNLASNGLIQLDIDFHFKGGAKKAKKLKNRISKLNSVVLCAISPTAYGLKVFVKSDISSSEMTDEKYQFAQKRLIKYFSLLFNVEEEYFDKFSIAQTCYLPFDPSVFVNHNAIAYHIDFTEFYKNKERIELKSTSIISDDEVSQAAKFLIENRICVASCNEEYFKFIAACKHTFGDDAKAIAYEILSNSESFNVSKAKKEFNKIFKGISTEREVKAGKQTILKHAKNNGFKYRLVQQQNNIANYEPQNLDLLIINRQNALDIIKKDSERKTIVCEKSYIEVLKKHLSGEKTIILTYSEINKINTKNIYVFGSQNLIRRKYLNTINTIERKKDECRIIFFSDTDTRCPLALRNIIIDAPALKAKIITSKNPAATFVELVKKDTNCYYLDTSESVKAQLERSQVVSRTELYTADKSKSLYVLFDSNCAMLPEHFGGFENVFFIVNEEKNAKECVSMQKFTYFNEKAIYDFLTFVDNDLYVSDIEKQFEETIKSKKLAVRKVGDKWERCNNTACVLEYEHEIKLLVSDVEQLKEYINKFSTVETENAVLSAESEEISLCIKESKQSLKAQKRDEFFEFIELLEADNSIINSVNYEVLKRGAKEAYKRVKILLKVNDNISTCIDAVKNSYSCWTKTKGQFFAAKVMTGKSKKAKDLRAFKDTVEGNTFEKDELINIAETFNLVSKNSKTAWIELKKMFVITGQRATKKQKGEVRKYNYEVHFLE